MPPPESKTLYYAVHVSNRATSRRGTGWVWSRAYDTPAEARAECKRVVADGDATLAFAVVLQSGRRVVMPRAIFPASAEGIIGHYLELCEALAAGQGAGRGE